MDGKLTAQIEGNHHEVTERLDSLKRFAMGESVLDRYATVEFDERLETVAKRVAALEDGR